MNPDAIEPYGLALKAFSNGDTRAELIIRRDDGQEAPLPAVHFFREPSEFTEIELSALKYCNGRILDVGGGTGIHSLYLQEKGLSVTAIDISPHAVEIMKQRGVKDVHCRDIFGFQDKPFDTILMMGHGIGMVETIDGLNRFLSHTSSLLTGKGQLLLDSLDVRNTDNPDDLAYHESNRQAGRYIGEIRMQFEFQGKKGPYCGWLHVDAETLEKRSIEAGLYCEVVKQIENGEYLARLHKVEEN